VFLNSTKLVLLSVWCFGNSLSSLQPSLVEYIVHHSLSSSWPRCTQYKKSPCWARAGPFVVMHSWNIASSPHAFLSWSHTVNQRLKSSFSFIPPLTTTSANGMTHGETILTLSSWLFSSASERRYCFNWM